MRKYFLGWLVLVVITLFAGGYVTDAYALKPVRIDVLYMNHGPLLDTLDQMKSVFSTYGDKISVSWHEFFSPEGKSFKAEKGIDRHIPLIIWIEGHEAVNLGQKQISFVGFPTGAGPSFFQGKWTIDDLKTALDQAVTKK